MSRSNHFSQHFTSTRRRSILSGSLAGGLLAAVCALSIPNGTWAQGKGEIRIAHIRSITGPLEAYGKQTSTGFLMGLDYATGGTMTVAGKKLVVIEKDDQGKPDVGKNLLAQAYGDDKADLAAVIARQQTHGGKVRGFVRKWRARKDSNL